jgi:dsDNA-binding SOS-regulon protein
MAALNRFISRLGGNGLPFFKLLKKSGKFEWTAEADEAFQKLKESLSNSPILTPPEKYEPLLLYIAATTTIVSTAIVVERAKEGHIYKVQ